MPRPRPSLTRQMPLLRRVSRSFFLSVRLLPAGLREPVAVAYLLARASDTLADAPGAAAATREEALQMFDEVVQGRASATGLARVTSHATTGSADETELVSRLPECVALLDALDGQDKQDVRTVLSHIIRGQRLDVTRFAIAGGANASAVVALRSAAQLDEYTWLVAGCVGEFWTQLCARHLDPFANLPLARMLELGRSFGMGLQLVNILRDLRDDLEARRCYLPEDELLALGISPAGLAVRPEAIRPVFDRWLSQAQQRMADGIAYADAVDDRRVRAACALPALLGARTLDLCAQAGPAGVLHSRIKMPRGEVRALVWRLMISLASRAAIAREYARAGGRAQGQWDNPRR